MNRYIERRSEERLIYYNGIQYRYRDDISTFLVIGIDDNDNEEESSLGEYYRNTVNWLPADIKVVEAILRRHTTFT